MASFDDEAMARAFIAYYLHDAASGRQRKAIRFLSMPRRPSGRPGRSEVNWRALHRNSSTCSALQYVVRAGEDARVEAGQREAFVRAKKEVDAVGRWMGRRVM